MVTNDASVEAVSPDRCCEAIAASDIPLDGRSGDAVCNVNPCAVETWFGTTVALEGASVNAIRLERSSETTHFLDLR